MRIEPWRHQEEGDDLRGQEDVTWTRLGRERGLRGLIAPLAISLVLLWALEDGGSEQYIQLSMP